MSRMPSRPRTEQTPDVRRRCSAAHEWLTSGGSTISTVAHSDVHAGEQITRGKYEVRSESNSGTAGLIVRKTDGSAQRFVLTCAHVLGGPSIKQDQAKLDEDAVYSPRLSKCLIELNSPVGSVVDATLVPPLPPDVEIEGFVEINGAKFGVDAALVGLSADAQADNTAPKIGAIAGVRDLISEWDLRPTASVPFDPARQLTVQKYGATTGLTSGKLVGLAATKGRAGGADFTAFILEIVADPTASPYEVEYELDMQKFLVQEEITDAQQIVAKFKGPVKASLSADKKRLKLRGVNFSLPGDSGSPIVDSNKKLVGFLTRGGFHWIYVRGEEPVQGYTGISFAILTAAALRHLNVEMMPATHHAAGSTAVRPGASLLARSDDETAILDETLAGVASSEEGALIHAIVNPHFHEIRDLITTNRNVARTWHRSRGAAFANALLRSARSRHFEVPTAIGGMTLRDALCQMRNALLTEGSESLRATIRAYDPWLLQLSRTGRLLRIENARGVPGTAGAVVRDAQGIDYLLSTHHVVFGGGARRGDAVWAVPALDGAGSGDGVLVGRACTGRIGPSLCGDETYFVDCALVRLQEQSAFPPWLKATLAGPWPTATTAPLAALEVLKHGPVTGTTMGAIGDAVYPDSAVVDGETVRAPNQLLIRSADPDVNFAAPGDSGAAIVDHQQRMVGVLWGCNETGDGIACPIEPVLGALDVSLVVMCTEHQGAL